MTFTYFVFVGWGRGVSLLWCASRGQRTWELVPSFHLVYLEIKLRSADLATSTLLAEPPLPPSSSTLTVSSNVANGGAQSGSGFCNDFAGFWSDGMEITQGAQDCSVAHRSEVLGLGQ